MNLDKIHSIYFLGIGGIGMSALARYFNARGKKVCGYDKTATVLTDELQAEGINIHFEDDINFFHSQIVNPKSEILIIYTPAIPKDHGEYAWFLNNGYTVLKRSQVLGLLTQQSFTIAVAGTHGKTTTSSIIAHILKTAGFDVTAFLGGIAKNYNTNLLLPEKGQRTGDKGKINEGTNFEHSTLNTKHCIVVEADEYDRSFLTLYPDVAVVTSMDADHLDIYGDANSMHDSYRDFVHQVKDNGVLISKPGLDLRPKVKFYSYAVNASADYLVKDIRIIDHQYVFDITNPSGVMKDLSIGLPGLHNVENACASVAVAEVVGVSEEHIRRALQTYSGVKRRFDYQVKTPEITYIDDYAHHPEELRACISSVKKMYEGKKITGIFQPHLYSRTRDFADGFAESLSMLDELILLEIYPAREQPIEGVTTKIIFDKVTITNKSLVKKSDLMNVLKDKKVEVLLTLGAGDIDAFVHPIKQMLLEKIKVENR